MSLLKPQLIGRIRIIRRFGGPGSQCIETRLSGNFKEASVGFKLYLNGKLYTPSSTMICVHMIAVIAVTGLHLMDGK